MVKCNTCKKEYPAIDDGWEKFQQANRCASEVYLYEGSFYLVGAYGSQVADMRKYHLQNSTNYELGTICDDCINILIDDGTATLMEDGIW